MLLVWCLDGLVRLIFGGSGECYYCKHGYSSRCAKSLLFGTAGLDGAQAEYVGDPWEQTGGVRRVSDLLQVRVPLADATVMEAPEGIADNVLVLMADIFPTGDYGLVARNEMGLTTKKDISRRKTPSRICRRRRLPRRRSL